MQVFKKFIIPPKITLIINILISINQAMIKHHRYRPMNTGETDTFRIEKSKKTASDITRRCSLQSLDYKVRKVQTQGSSGNFVEFQFKAIPGDAPELKDGEGNLLLDEKIDSNIFNTRQIGISRCEIGVISLVYVRDNAKNCGIGTVLTELCMIDPIMNQNTNDNHIYKFLSKIGTDEAQGVRELLISQCSQGLIGLTQASQSHFGGFAYLSAAKRMQYQYMVVQFFNTKAEKHTHSSGQCSQKFKTYKVEHALKIYNGHTGNIEQGDGESEGSGYKARWYFCRMVKNKKWTE